jgi:hypothetical protein
MADKTTPPIKPLRMWASVNARSGVIHAVGATRKLAGLGFSYAIQEGKIRVVRVAVTAEEPADK